MTGDAMPPKVFTVGEVDRLIPRMEDVLSRVREELFHIENRRDKLAVLDALWGSEVLEPANPDHGEFAAHHRRMRTAAERIDSLVRSEITGEGIRFPAGGLEHGLLDFPTTWEGRWVYLCWRTGEERVAWWHELDGGFAGRQPVTDEHARAMGRSGGGPGGSGGGAPPDRSDGPPPPGGEEGGDASP